ncbi:hypothetical protein FCH28_04590 [Streptomyces piniterrae]|uniref:Uncharacterized protein n=1 Tax=Streptomyces piniterrae TaxID=2571125 RepID=A0A4U0NQR9_9ACTN|nr:hypothetical protein [Streptomyces piniterrae]TJZ56807.1 hypothetical protein FCH28_04590 [Streptomyces piniterrae]
MSETLRLFSDPGMSGKENDVQATTGDHKLQPGFTARSASNDSHFFAELYSDRDPSAPVAEIPPHDTSPMLDDVPIDSVRFIG